MEPQAQLLVAPKAQLLVALGQDFHYIHDAKINFTLSAAGCEVHPWMQLIAGTNLFLDQVPQAPYSCNSGNHLLQRSAEIPRCPLSMSSWG